MMCLWTVYKSIIENVPGLSIPQMVSQMKIMHFTLVNMTSLFNEPRGIYNIL